MQKRISFQENAEGPALKFPEFMALLSENVNGFKSLSEVL
jgi:hypothetical protein